MLALRSVFQASESGPVTYKLWSAESTDQARVLLIDGESWEASLELANPGHDTLKLVWVGSRAPANGDSTENTNNVSIMSMGVRNDKISVSPVWIMVGYGICMDAACGD